MKHSDYLKKKKNRETRKKIISVISAIVVFITTYALVLPAITLDVSKASQEPGIAFEQMQFAQFVAAGLIHLLTVTAVDEFIRISMHETDRHVALPDGCDRTGLPDMVSIQQQTQ